MTCIGEENDEDGGALIVQKSGFASLNTAGEEKGEIRVGGEGRIYGVGKW